jgi:hypothetical protein
MSSDNFPLELRDLTTAMVTWPSSECVDALSRAAHHHDHRIERRRQVHGDQGRGRPLALLEGTVLTEGRTSRTSRRRRVGRGIGYVPQGRVVVPR